MFRIKIITWLCIVDQKSSVVFVVDSTVPDAEKSITFNCFVEEKFGASVVTHVSLVTLISS